MNAEFCVEFWVMRVLLHPGPMRHKVTTDNVPTNERAAVLANVARGTLAVLPDKCIAEPVEVFATSDLAHEHAAKLAADKPHDDFRVVLNADVTL